jgi:hypothetical protein
MHPQATLLSLLFQQIENIRRGVLTMLNPLKMHMQTARSIGQQFILRRRRRIGRENEESTYARVIKEIVEVVYRLIER